MWPIEKGQSEISTVFFRDKFILAHFSFAQFVLERICSTNTQLQRKYIFLPDAWVFVNKLKGEFSLYSREKQNIFTTFEYLGDLSGDQVVSFLDIIDHFLLNTDFRFPCPGISFDMKNAQEYLNPSSTAIEETFMKEIQRKCPLFEKVDLFLFPRDLIWRRQINPIIISGNYPEILPIAREIVEREEEIKAVKRSDRGGVGCDENEVITLTEVFKVVEKTKYPMLWKTTLNILSFLPTTVGCEQSFGFLKHKMHQNMSKENAFNLCQASQRESQSFPL